MTRFERVIAWVVHPRYREEILGDLEEMHRRRVVESGRGAAALLHLRDALSACLLVSRAGPRFARRFLVATVMGSLAVVTLVTRLETDAVPYTINAVDPYGTFTLDIAGARVVGATLDGQTVPWQRLIQSDTRLVIVEGAGTDDLVVHLTPDTRRWYHVDRAAPAARRVLSRG